MKQIQAKARHILLFILLLPALISCNREPERKVADGLKGLYTQLEKSCESGRAYKKEVYDLNVSPQTREDSVYQLSSENASLHCPLIRDMVYAYEEYFDQEGLIDYFNQTESGDTLIARILPEYSSSIQLQEQKVVKEGDRFRYFESYSHMESWLYNLDVRIQVYFDESGLYSSHRLKILNEVPWLNESFKSLVEAKMAGS
ncbi:MAG: hypothetical protein AAFR87_11700 [Bacteroidota bacterium]